ncbi:MAG: hypothetical protein NVS1B7_7510 [Candidatus Saccharimonadales bacterium]
MNRNIKKKLFKQIKSFEIKEVHKHPYMIPLVALLILSITSTGLFVYFTTTTVLPRDTHVVIISSDHKRQTIPTRAITVGDFLKRINVQLRPGDVVEPATSTDIVEDNFRVNVYRARPVMIVDGGHKMQSFSAATTARSVAEQAGVKVFPEDKLMSQPTTDFLRDGSIGEQILIDRATLTNLNLYGTAVEIRTHAKTVKELLVEKHITLGSGDTVTPAPSTVLAQHTQVFVTRFGTQIVTQEESIPMTVETVEDGSLSFGTVAVRQQGSPGKKVVTYQLELTNGKETGRQKIQEVVSVTPVTQITARGRAVDIPEDKTSIMAAAGISSSDYAFVSYIISRESGWCPSKWQGESGFCPSYFEAKYPINSGVGYGLCQSTPAGKMASAGSDWQTNPVTQLRWCSGYANGRYGSWAAAYEHWAAYHNW